MKAKGIICNATFNYRQYLESFDQIKSLSDKKLLWGIGVSVQKPMELTIKNTVAHMIVGLATPEEILEQQKSNT